MIHDRKFCLLSFKPKKIFGPCDREAVDAVTLVESRRADNAIGDSNLAGRSACYSWSV